MKSKIVSAMLCVAMMAGVCAAQIVCGQRTPDHALVSYSGAVRVVPNAKVTVCQDKGCTQPVTVYSDSACTQPLTAVPIDTVGNYSYFAPVGIYWEQVSGAGVNPYTQPVSVPLVGANAVLANGTYDNPSWLNSLPWTKISGRPNTLAGYGITGISIPGAPDGCATWSGGSLASTGNACGTGSGGGAGTVLAGTAGQFAYYAGNGSTVQGRTLAVADIPSLTGLYPSLSGSYSDPSWLTSLNWSKLISKPTTLAGFGVTDGVSTGGSYSNPSWLTSLASSKISGSLPESQVSNLTNDLAAKAPSASPVFSGDVTTNTAGSGHVFTDASNGHTYRLYVDGGNLKLVQVN